MWHDHPFSKKNKATKRALALRLETRGGGVGQNLKKRWRGEVGNIGMGYANYVKILFSMYQASSQTKCESVEKLSI